MDPEELKVQAANANSGIIIKKVNIHLFLQPTGLDNIEEKVDQELEQRLYSYHKDFDGMLLYYEDMAVRKKGGSIHIDEDGFPHLDVRVKAFIFRPVKGVETTATVVEEHTNLIDCRLFDNIYLTVIKNQSNVKLNPHDIVRVTLTDVAHHHHRTKLHGNILSVVSQSHKCGGGWGKENKKILFNDEDEYTEDVSTKVKVEPTTTDPSEGEEESRSSKKKKKRKQKDRDENLNITSPEKPLGEVTVKVEKEEPPPEEKKKKKKKKKEKRALEETTEDDGYVSPAKKKRKKDKKAEILLQAVG